MAFESLTKRFTGSDDGQRPDRRAALAAGGGVLLALLAVAVYVLFFTGSGADQLLGPVTVQGTPVTTASPSATPTTLVALGTRDPFAPLPGTVADAALAGAATPTATAAPTASPSPSPTATGTPFVFKLVALSPTTATVLVNGHSYTPTVGTAFATYFKLYAIFGTTCAGFQYKTSQTLALCVGDSTVLTP